MLHLSACHVQVLQALRGPAAHLCRRAAAVPGVRGQQCSPVGRLEIATAWAGMQHALEMRRYPLSCLLQIAALLSSLAVHTRQPSQVYILNACNAGEKLQAALRVEAFRSLLARDRGLRALLEALGTVGVLFALRWEGQLLGCSAAGCCMRSLHWCRCPPPDPTTAPWSLALPTTHPATQPPTCWLQLAAGTHPRGRHCGQRVHRLFVPPPDAQPGGHQRGCPAAPG